MSELHGSDFDLVERLDRDAANAHLEELYATAMGKPGEVTAAAAADMLEYMKGRPIMGRDGHPRDARGRLLPADHFDKQRDQHYQDTLVTDPETKRPRAYSSLKVVELARRLGQAEVAGDQTLVNNLSDILLDKMAVMADEQNLSIDAQEALWNRLMRLKDVQQHLMRSSTLSSISQKVPKVAEPASQPKAEATLPDKLPDGKSDDPTASMKGGSHKSKKSDPYAGGGDDNSRVITTHTDRFHIGEASHRDYHRVLDRYARQAQDALDQLDAQGDNPATWTQNEAAARAAISRYHELADPLDVTAETRQEDLNILQAVVARNNERAAAALEQQFDQLKEVARRGSMGVSEARFNRQLMAYRRNCLFGMARAGLSNEELTQARERLDDQLGRLQQLYLGLDAMENAPNTVSGAEDAGEPEDARESLDQPGNHDAGSGTEAQASNETGGDQAPDRSKDQEFGDPEIGRAWQHVLDEASRRGVKAGSRGMQALEARFRQRFGRVQTSSQNGSIPNTNADKDSAASPRERQRQMLIDRASSDIDRAISEFEAASEKPDDPQAAKNKALAVRRARHAALAYGRLNGFKSNSAAMQTASQKFERIFGEPLWTNQQRRRGLAQQIGRRLLLGGRKAKSISRA